MGLELLQQVFVVCSVVNKVIPTIYKGVVTAYAPYERDEPVGVTVCVPGGSGVSDAARNLEVREDQIFADITSLKNSLSYDWSKLTELMEDLEK